MDDASPITALFVGGPLHGTQQQFAEAPDYLPHHLPDGTMVPYTPRPGIAVTPGIRLYAPVGMTSRIILEFAQQLVQGTPM